MVNKELRLLIEELKESGFEDRANELFNWLRPGEKKDTLESFFDLVAWQDELIHNLSLELIKLRKEQNEPVQRFYPMSTTARKLY